MGKNQEVYDAELHAIYRAVLTLFPRTPWPEDLRRRPSSLTEDYIRRTKPRTATRSRNRTTGTQPMGATKSLRGSPAIFAHSSEAARNERGSEQLPYEFSSTSLAHLKRGITERKWVEA